MFACRPGPLKAALRDLCLQGTCSDNAAGALLMLNKYLGVIKVGTAVVSEWRERGCSSKSTRCLHFRDAANWQCICRFLWVLPQVPIFCSCITCLHWSRLYHIMVKYNPSVSSPCSSYIANIINKYHPSVSLVCLTHIEK
jgi:hypothetical protein